MLKLCVKCWAIIFCSVGVFGVLYEGYLSNAEDDPEGAVPVIIKTVKGELCIDTAVRPTYFIFSVLSPLLSDAFTAPSLPSILCHI